MFHALLASSLEGAVTAILRRVGMPGHYRNARRGKSCQTRVRPRSSFRAHRLGKMAEKRGYIPRLSDRWNLAFPQS
jgi:hypothetical protein